MLPSSDSQWEPRDCFRASRGLKQCDSLSSLLFTLIVDILSRILARARKRRSIKGLKAGTLNVQVYDLHFVDDTILFLENDNSSMSNALVILYVFEHISGLKINLGKNWIHSE